MKVKAWENCYDLQWGKMLVPEAFCHPAKVSPGLAKRIFEHCLEQGYIEKGSICIDPFGGVLGFGIWAASFGIQFVGIELEEKFYRLAQDNVKLHERAWKKLGMPIPRIIQGDSRRLSEIVGGADGCVMSPPYAESVHSGNGIDPSCLTGNVAGKHSQAFAQGYGHSPGQIGVMKAGSVDAACTSPPFSEPGCQPIGKCLSRLVRSKLKAMGLDDKTEYGWTDGQIGNLRAGDVGAVCDGIVTSPPFEMCDQRKPGIKNDAKRPDGSAFDMGRSMSGYPDSPGQLGQTSGTSYWEAMRDIYRECYKILKPQGILIVVLKAYIKQGRRVPLPQQTLKLLIHLGFEPLERIKAMLVKQEVTPGLFGDVVKTKARKSFFRRLAESKGSPPIDWEEVLVCRKP